MYTLKNTAKKVLRWLLILTLWTFAFSINISGEPIFNHANRIIVKNSFVQGVGQKIIQVWDSATSYTKLALKEFYQDGKKQKKAHTYYTDRETTGY